MREWLKWFFWGDRQVKAQMVYVKWIRFLEILRLRKKDPVIEAIKKLNKEHA